MFIRHFFAFLLLTLCIFLSSGQVFAKSDLYVVKDVEVDIQSDNAVSAQTQAIQTAQKKAMNILAKRLLSNGSLMDYVEPEISEIQNMIQGFQVSDEKIASKRYVAKITFKFVPQHVKEYFDRFGKKTLQEVSKPTLILPFYQKGEHVLLWEDANLWMQAWRERETRSSVVPLVLPLGDLQDRSDIPDMASVTSSRDKLFEMAERSGAFQAVPAIFVVDEENPLKARIFLFGYNSDPSMQLSETLDIEVEAEESLLSEGISSVVDLLEDRWKTMSLMRSDFSNQIRAYVTFQKLSEWVKLKKSLENVSVIKELQVDGLKQGIAEVSIRFKGSLDGVRFALNEQGLSLAVTDKGDYYIRQK